MSSELCLMFFPKQEQRASDSFFSFFWFGERSMIDRPARKEWPVSVERSVIVCGTYVPQRSMKLLLPSREYTFLSSSILVHQITKKSQAQNNVVHIIIPRYIRGADRREGGERGDTRGAEVGDGAAGLWQLRFFVLITSTTGLS